MSEGGPPVSAAPSRTPSLRWGHHHAAAPRHKSAPAPWHHVQLPSAEITGEKTLPGAKSPAMENLKNKQKGGEMWNANKERAAIVPRGERAQLCENLANRVCKLSISFHNSRALRSAASLGFAPQSPSELIIPSRPNCRNPIRCADQAMRLPRNSRNNFPAKLDLLFRPAKHFVSFILCSFFSVFFFSFSPESKYYPHTALLTSLIPWSLL